MADFPTLTDADLEAIETRLKAATQGPWVARGAVISSSSVSPALLERYVLEDAFMGRADAEFIAAARADVERLLAYVRHLRQVARNRQDWG